MTVIIILCKNSKNLQFLKIVKISFLKFSGVACRVHNHENLIHEILKK